jgi:TonB-linked SusC/RagA family outer membrane protein
MSEKTFLLKIKTLGACLMLLSCATAATWASTDATQQQRRVTVIVSDATGPVIGANVVVKGTTNGNISDLDGRVALDNVPADATLLVSYVGYVSQEIPVRNQSDIRVKLVEDSQTIDEVVVVGYGTQAKKDITGSVVVVDTESLQETPVATVAEALQGKASGLYISSSGAPGSETTIRIRGIGSVNGSDPLIIVDGISNVDISSVNPNDIESVQILKDASAAAIYGAQGANGVIIITTKQGGKEGRVRISYNGYMGVATMANDGYDLLNAWEVMDFWAQGMVNNRDVKHDPKVLSHAQFGSLDANDKLTMPYSIKPSGLSEQQIVSLYGSVAAWEASYLSNGANSWSRSAYAQMKLEGYSEEEARAGTDWYSQIIQNGKVQDHQLSIQGGGEKGSYTMSLGVQNREGTIINSYFDRYSLRVNTTFTPNKWLTLGQNTNLSFMETGGDRGSWGDDTPFSQSYTIQPWVPVYNIGGEFAGSQAPEGGRASTAVSSVLWSVGDWTRFFMGQTALFAEITPTIIPGLRLRTQWGGNLRGNWNRTMNERNIMMNKEGRSDNYLQETAGYNFDWQWTNTASYTRKFNDVHNMTVLLGSEALRMNNGREISGTRRNYTFESVENTWTLDNGATANVSNSGYIRNLSSMFGLFMRADYSYDGTYLATFSVRRDASSRFGADNRWGTFPSLSLGWRMSDEDFMEPYRQWLDDFKWRAGYGMTGNSNIGAYNWAFQYATGNRYIYANTGTDSDVIAGYAVNNLGDANAKWEATRTLNIGFDVTALNNKLTINAEWWTRRTTDMLVPANWSALAGAATKPNINIGDMDNKGVDLSIGYRDKVGKDFRYNLTANLSTYRNKVIRLGSADIFTATRISKVTITTEGQPIGMFYGYNVLGIYTSADDVMNYKTDKGETILPYLVEDVKDLNPDNFIGRYKLEDVNGDGKIAPEDQTIIGNPHPDFTGGLNVSLNYKNFDLSTYLYFSVGNDIYKHYMYYTHFGQLQSNFSKDRRDNSWHPVTNPNGIYPLWATANLEGKEATEASTSRYIDDGSYLRMQTISLGYSLPRRILQNIGLERLRVYGQIGNAFTLTKYPGLDPEVRGGNNDNNGANRDRTRGVDYGSYGMPRQFIIGLNVAF